MYTGVSIVSFYFFYKEIFSCTNCLHIDFFSSKCLVREQQTQHFLVYSQIFLLLTMHRKWTRSSRGEDPTTQRDGILSGKKVEWVALNSYERCNNNKSLNKTIPFIQWSKGLSLLCQGNIRDKGSLCNRYNQHELTTLTWFSRATMLQSWCNLKTQRLIIHLLCLWIQKASNHYQRRRKPTEMCAELVKHQSFEVPSLFPVFLEMCMNRPVFAQPRGSPLYRILIKYKKSQRKKPFQ